MSDRSPEITEPLLRYEAEAETLLGFISFVGYLVTRADEVAVIAARALLGSADEDERGRLEQTIERGGGTVKAMKQHYAQLFTRLAFQRMVDNFLGYLAELLRLIFVTRPEALRSAETVRAEEILRHETMDELIRFLVERRVERLTYLSIKDLADDLERSLGMRLLDGPEEVAKAVRAVAIRNLIAHNRSEVNPRFLRQAPDFEKAEDEVWTVPKFDKQDRNDPYAMGPDDYTDWKGQIWITAADFADSAEFLTGLAARVDQRAIAHFNLPADRSPVPPGRAAAPSDQQSQATG